MKVFISWSGPLSKKLAEAIRDWLPGVIQMVNPYFTPSDIEKGGRWSTDIAKELSSSEVGVLCITRDNIHSDWILFEAGALSKSLEKSHVCPILFGINNADLAGPLKQFQTTEFNRSDFFKLITVINGRLGEGKLPPKTLETVFDKWWPDLEVKVREVLENIDEDDEPLRTDREILEEVLLLSRAVAKRGTGPSIPSGAVVSLLEGYIQLHDLEASERGSYGDSLNIMQKTMDKPMRYIADKYSGSSSEMNTLINRLKSLSYTCESDETEDIDDEGDIPF
ncbi:TIR domain-containing protein [Pseudomonas aeruginosa]|uniref:TIR domain-containing protein n=1 Tax=Pseudomonas aeruginosa TaxID=287 RepID=UPI000F521FD1|nr:TIR domain-containing protein [Pseudomonas aeruginosa]EMB0011973.1 toll/interleukin-1 receptor domain-containing protein [Pseudomonas aeruginosa]MCT5451476.1 toll/interleukin-1 receptor domain-containing protein [Pseudomonas aeruginosa]MDY1517118.1 TIR domain-containing protein [Pseudomonas aeruginosa]RQG01654.1 hypothetical protein IPC215_29775 [Pseudomonas aeruginosa]HCF1391794.1 toll/interleukin-1 receptor domain-containing protein [Pseudomonas aeruginosa]